MLILSASVLSQVKPTTSITKTLSEDIKYINRMRNEIQKAENSPNDIEPLRRHSASDIVLIPDGMLPVSGQENAVNMMKQIWEIFDVKMEYHSEEVKIDGDTAIDRGWAEGSLKNKKTNEITENHSNYLWISKKDKNGVWKQTYVIWNKRS
jgi:ketosteroid isomerase-like protein